MGLARTVLSFVLVAACTKADGASVAPTGRTPTAVPNDDSAVAWADVRAEMDALVCVKAFEHPEMGTYEVPLSGERAACGLPAAATPLERAVERVFADSKDVLVAFPEEGRAAQEAARTTKGNARLPAVRKALFTDRYLAPIQRRLPDALAKEGLECSDCPTPSATEPRVVAWTELAPYVAAYVWPDPVVTPKGADGKPGKPTYSMHICVGLNGLSTLPKVDEDVRFAAQLAAFHTEALHERAAATLGEVLAEKAYVALRTDDERTAYLRANVGSRVAADPDVRRGICSTLARLQADVAVRLECEG